MATGCVKCTPDDVALLEAVQAARKLANEQGFPVGVYSSPEGYKIMKAEILINEKTPIVQIISVGA